VTDEAVAALGGGKGPAVRATLGGHCYRTKVARMGGRFVVPLNAVNREAAGVAAGDEVDAVIEMDTALRAVELPEDLKASLSSDSPRGSSSISCRSPTARSGCGGSPELRRARLAPLALHGRRGYACGSANTLIRVGMTTGWSD
jgi:hypothetical protein